MTSSRQSRFALAVVPALLIVLTSCNKPTVAQAGPFAITLAYNNGQCTQNGSTGVIDVEQDWDVTYKTASAMTPFNVQFSSCPFATGKCPVSSGGSQNPGTPTASSVNNTYYYSTVSINNQTCNNGPGTLGLHIKPISARP